MQSLWREASPTSLFHLHQHHLLCTHSPDLPCSSSSPVHSLCILPAAVICTLYALPDSIASELYETDTIHCRGNRGPEGELPRVPQLVHGRRPVTRTEEKAPEPKLPAIILPAYNFFFTGGYVLLSAWLKMLFTCSSICTEEAMAMASGKDSHGNTNQYHATRVYMTSSPALS